MRVLKHAGWALMAGALGMSPAAVQALEPSGLTGYSTPATPGRQHSPSVDRLAEIKVELALLADPATFGCELATHVTGEGLELCGYVPNEAVRERALALARANSAVDVVDALRIHSQMALRSPIGSNEEVRQAVTATLSEMMGRHAEEVDCKVRTGGQVIISGAAASYEDMLKVSKRLRRVRGCMCVVNKMTVKPVVCDGRMFEPVSADATLTVPVQGPATMKPAYPVQAVKQSSGAWGPYGMPAVTAPQSVSKPPVAVPAASIAESRPVVQAPVRAPAPQTYALPAPSSSYAMTPAPQTPVTVEPAATVKADTPKPVQSAVTPVAWNSAAPTATAAKAAPVGEAYVTTGVVTFTEEEPVPLAASKTPAHAVQKTPVLKTPPPATPVQSTIITPPTSGLLPMASMNNLKKSIETVCGTTGNGVTIAQNAGNTLEVHVKVRSTEEGQQLGPKIMAMPELLPYEVKLKVEITPQ